MFRLVIPSTELFDEETEEFIYTKERVLMLEHSLVSISKWESMFCIPFLDKDVKTWFETVEYIRCMTITQNVPASAYKFLTNQNIRDVDAYIDARMTATTIKKSNSSSREIITAELIYYWMISLGIPFECQKWHLNKLLMLINVCSIKNQPPKKHSRAEIINRNRDLNQARREKYNTKG